MTGITTVHTDRENPFPDTELWLLLEFYSSFGNLRLAWFQYGERSLDWLIVDRYITLLLLPGFLELVDFN